MWDNILDFVEDHRKLVIAGVVIFVLLGVCVGIRSCNMNKKKQLQQQYKAEEEAKKQQSLKQDADVSTSSEPESEYKQSLGLDVEPDDDRVKIDKNVIKQRQKKKNQKVKTDPTFPVDAKVFDHTGVPKLMVDGSSCRAYLKKVSLSDFGSKWGTRLTLNDFNAKKRILVGVDQNPDDFIKADLQSVGWLMNRLSSLENNVAIKFTNLHIIGSLSASHVAVLCEYDWYSAFGLKDTLVVFEDISGKLDVKKFGAGDVFSATVFVHNMKIKTVNGQRVLVVQYQEFSK